MQFFITRESHQPNLAGPLESEKNYIRLILIV